VVEKGKGLLAVVHPSLESPVIHLFVLAAKLDALVTVVVVVVVVEAKALGEVEVLEVEAL
jgi:hypothetical protein